MGSGGCEVTCRVVPYGAMGWCWEGCLEWVAKVRNVKIRVGFGVRNVLVRAVSVGKRQHWFRASECLAGLTGPLRL